jgi:hypothetical protein
LKGFQVADESTQGNVAPAPAPAPAAEGKVAPAASKSATNAKAAAQAPEPDAVVEEDVGTSTIGDDADNANVAKLKEYLQYFLMALDATGDKPTDFAEAAGINAQFTKLIIQHPKVPMLDTLLAFYVENKDKLDKFMKGSTTLPPVEEQQVGYLHGLFEDLALRRPVRVDAGQVARVLKKPEFGNYYNRKMNGIRQNKSEG